MSVRRLETRDWQSFCAHLSRCCAGTRARIEVLSPALGIRVEADGATMFGIHHDARHDVLELFVRDLDHRIRAPRELYVDEAPRGSFTLQVVTENGLREIITLEGTRAPAAGAA